MEVTWEEHNISCMPTADVYRDGAMRSEIQLVRYATSSFAPYQLEIELLFLTQIVWISAILAWLHGTTSPVLVWAHSDELQFILLLILRHTRPVILSGTNEYSFPLFMIFKFLFYSVRIILPIYAIVKAVTALQRHCHQQEEYYASSSFISSDEESEHSTPQSPSHVVCVH
ncbi:hypothetical protein Dsin_030669 [Dipteronia sinensis]|uniref:Uncharacterized protein n=1 Tax=Dipteronia sinensis TaxID=43782 RepID=A0AAD9ZJP7_9ROSI|nr:hypothetical protein Dsin_030669 [Dipteronia sinensis]